MTRRTVVKMRLVDADNLKQELTAERDSKNGYSNWDWGYSGGLLNAIEKVVAAPTVDAVEVVRCKDCKHFDMQRMECQCDAIASDNEGGADYTINFYLDDFCSYGERR